jgi:hypothetical protein
MAQPTPTTITFHPSTEPTHHATHLVVQTMPGKYVLSFYECLPPLIIETTPEAQRAAWERIPTIEARCVTRLIVSADDLPSFLQTLQQQLQQAQQPRFVPFTPTPS